MAATLTSVRRIFECAPLLLAVIALLVSGCDSSPQEVPPTPSSKIPTQELDAKMPAVRGPDSWNVVLISLDTVRADALGAYGQVLGTSANIDRMAKEGVVFEQVAAPAPMTLPSHASIFTGKDPYAHGVRSNYGYVLSHENETLAEVIKKRGYLTAAEIGASVMARKTQIAQGFDHIRDPDSPDVELLKVIKNAKGPEVTLPARVGYELSRKATDFMRKHRDKPFFLWLHYFDAHGPYIVPEPYMSQFSEDPYLAGVAYVDAQVGKVLDEIRRLGIQDHTLVVLTSDHGEGLGEHSEATHSDLLYETTIRVPLLLWGPSQLPAGLRIKSLVRTIDIAPTILDLLEMPALSGIQGTSLTSLIRGEQRDLALIAYGESHNLHYIFGLQPLRFVREGSWKYIHKVNPELYDLSSDPRELENLAQRKPQIRERFFTHLERLLSDAGSEPAGARVEVDARRKAELSALGYLDGETVRNELNELESLALIGADANDMTRAVAEYSEAEEAKVGGRYQEAEQIYGKLLEINPTSPKLLSGRGYCLAKLDRDNEAIALFNQGLKVHPKDRDLLEGLSEIMQRHEDKAEAIRVWMAFVEVEPCSSINDLLARQLHAEKRYVEQRDVLVASVASCPKILGVANNLAWLLATSRDETVRDGAMALEIIQRAMAHQDSNKNNPAYLDTLAAAMAELGRFEEAVRVQKRTLEILKTMRVDSAVVASFEEHLTLYQNGAPVRDP